ncbi:hypothetical protein Tco_0040862 [Tanacetum coccineum]
MGRYLRKIFRIYEGNGITDDPMEQKLKSSGIFGRLTLWVIELNTYCISYLSKATVEGQVVKKFLREEEQIKRILMRHLAKFPVSEDDMDYEPYWPDHSPSQTFKPKGRSTNQTSNHSVRVFEPRGVSRLKIRPSIEAPDIGSEKSRKTRDQSIPGKHFKENRGFRKKSTFQKPRLAWGDHSGSN